MFGLFDINYCDISFICIDVVIETSSPSKMLDPGFLKENIDEKSHHNLAWTMVQGPWSKGQDPSTKVRSRRKLSHGSWDLAYRPGFEFHSHRTLVLSWRLKAKRHGSMIAASGTRRLDLGPRTGVTWAVC